MFHHNKDTTTTTTHPIVGAHDKSEFRLRVIEGRGLFGGDTTSQSDPYLVVKLKGLKHLFNAEKQTSEVINNRSNPVWNQDFLLHAKPNDIILVKVYDRDRAKKDTYLGRVEIPVANFTSGLGDTWLPLVGKKGAKAHGELHINSTYGGGMLPSTGLGTGVATGLGTGVATGLATGVATGLATGGHTTTTHHTGILPSSTGDAILSKAGPMGTHTTHVNTPVTNTSVGAPVPLVGAPLMGTVPMGTAPVLGAAPVVLGQNAPAVVETATLPKMVTTTTTVEEQRTTRI
jgi:Ca2+-dependent lipid-binding protein